MKSITNTPTEQPFKGYTLDELRYQRALVLLKKEFSKQQLTESFKQIKANSPLVAFNGTKGTKSSIVGKILKSLDYMDYAMMGYSLFKSIRKFTSKFKKNKE